MAPGSTHTSVRRLVELGLPAASTVTAEVGVFAVATALAGTPRTGGHGLAPDCAQHRRRRVHDPPRSGLGGRGAGGERGRRPQSPRRRGGRVDGDRDGRGVHARFRGRCSWPVPRILIGLFTTTRPWSRWAPRCCWIAAVFQLFDGLQGVVTGTLRGLGDTRTPMVTNLAAHWLIGLPIGYWLCFVMEWGRTRPLVGPVDRPDRGRRRPHRGVGAARGTVVEGSGFEVRGSRFGVRGSRFEVRGSRLLRFEVRGSRFEVRGSRFEVLGARLRGSTVRGFEVTGLRRVAAPMARAASSSCLPPRSPAGRHSTRSKASM